LATGATIGITAITTSAAYSTTIIISRATIATNSAISTVTTIATVRSTAEKCYPATAALATLATKSRSPSTACTRVCSSRSAILSLNTVKAIRPRITPVCSAKDSYSTFAAIRASTTFCTSKYRNSTVSALSIRATVNGNALLRGWLFSFLWTLSLGFLLCVCVLYI
jgi:hypothetical protein